MVIELMDIKRQYLEHCDVFDKVALDVLHSGKYIGGQCVKDFEDKFAKYYDSKYAISCGNGTDALVLALKALNIGVGDEIITTPFTFFATAEAIASVGAIPVFVDVNINDYCIDCSLIEEKITKKTKALLPVHIYGQSCDMDGLRMICSKYGLKLITDCAQCTGTMYKGARKYTLGDVACFSFFPTKILGCAGDGGMVVTDDDDIAASLRAYKVHGSNIDGYNTLKRMYENRKDNWINEIELVEDKYHNYLVGCNSRLDALQANILNEKLGYIDNYVDRRRYIARMYDDAFKNSEYKTPYVPDYSYHTYYIYALQHSDVSRVMNILRDNGIGTGIYYPVPLHLQPAFCDLGYKKGDLPNAEYLSSHTFAIPVYPELKDEEIKYIINILMSK